MAVIQHAKQQQLEGGQPSEAAYSLLSPTELSSKSLALLSLLEVELERCRSTSALVDTGSSAADDGEAEKRACSEFAGVIDLLIPHADCECAAN